MSQNLIGQIAGLFIILAAVGIAFLSMARLDENSGGKQAARIKELMKRAAVQCYALEGAYPPDVKYFERYGIKTDEEKFFFRYELSVGNYMPEIYVLPR